MPELLFNANYIMLNTDDYMIVCVPNRNFTHKRVKMKKKNERKQIEKRHTKKE